MYDKVPLNQIGRNSQIGCFFRLEFILLIPSSVTSLIKITELIPEAAQDTIPPPLCLTHEFVFHHPLFLSSSSRSLHIAFAITFTLLCLSCLHLEVYLCSQSIFRTVDCVTPALWTLLMTATVGLGVFFTVLIKATFTWTILLESD